MAFARHVGLRFLRPKKGQLLFSVVTIIAVTGVAVGVATLVVVISAISGYQENMTQKILGAYSHMLVLSHHNKVVDWPSVVEKIEEIDGVRGASPFVYGEAMATTAEHTTGVVLRGIHPETAPAVTSIGQSIGMAALGKLDQLHAPQDDLSQAMDKTSLPGIILGKELARTLSASEGQKVYIVNPLSKTAQNQLMPKTQAFLLVGLFNSGMYEFDSTFAFVGLKTAQQYFSYGDSVSGIEISLDNIWNSAQVGEEIEHRLGWPFYVRDWQAMNRNLFSALKLQKLVMFVILCLIVFVASLNIFSVLYMVLMDKKRSIAMIRAMGASARTVKKIVFIQGMFIGVLGSIIGAILGLAMCLIQIRYGFIKLDPSVYFIDTLPMAFNALDFTIIFVAALSLSLVATMIPARMAARLEAVEVLRYE